MSTLTTLTLTDAFEDDMEEWDNRPVDKGVLLVNEGLFDHLVARNIHHPLAASPQAEHWAILLSKLQSQSDQYGHNTDIDRFLLSLL